MNTVAKTFIIIAVIIGVLAVMGLKQSESPAQSAEPGRGSDRANVANKTTVPDQIGKPAEEAENAPSPLRPDAPAQAAAPDTGGNAEFGMNTEFTITVPVLEMLDSLPAPADAPAAETTTEPLPRLLDLGRHKCIPCKKMAPILAELKSEYAGRMIVEFVDVNKHPEAADAHGIMMIPTQIFFDASGKERFRHEGFMAKEEILAQWQALGIGFEHRDDEAAVTETAATQSTGLFAALNRALESTPLIGLTAAFVWGVLSILLSPCHLASIPLIVGFVGRQGQMSTRRALATSTLFAVGILLTIAVIGAVTGAAGRMLGDVGKYGNYFVAGVFLLVGLHLLGVIPMPWSGPAKVDMKRKGMAAAFILGAVFGIALGPCTFAYMAPMLGMTFRVAADRVLYGVLLLAAYGVGHCSVIVIAGTSTGLVQRYLNWNERSRSGNVLKAVCGVLVLLGGLYMIYTAA